MELNIVDRPSSSLSWKGAIGIPLPNMCSTSLFYCNNGREVSSLKLLKIEAREPPKTESAKVRYLRARRKLFGTVEKPRMVVFRSTSHIYVVVSDDSTKHTVAFGSTLQQHIQEGLETYPEPIIEAGKRVGEEIAKACLERGISTVAYDRSKCALHGGVKALVEAAKQNGLEFDFSLCIKSKKYR